MATVNVFSVHITGDIGGAGIARFHVHNNDFTGLGGTTIDTVNGHLHDMYGAFAGLTPSHITYQIDQVVDQVEVATGALQSVASGTTVPAAISGSGSGNYVAGTGARIYWHTSNVRHRRLVRGATLLCPLDNDSFTTTGAVDATRAGILQGYAHTFLSSMAGDNLVPAVYSRPSATGATDGALADIVAVTIGTKPCSLRSRRS